MMCLSRLQQGRQQEQQQQQLQRQMRCALMLQSKVQPTVLSHALQAAACRRDCWCSLSLHLMDAESTADDIRGHFGVNDVCFSPV
jgi:hypothetical protein